MIVVLGCIEHTSIPAVLWEHLNLETSQHGNASYKSGNPSKTVFLGLSAISARKMEIPQNTVFEGFALYFETFPKIFEGFPLFT